MPFESACVAGAAQGFLTSANVIDDYVLVVAGVAAMLNHFPSGCRAALRKRLPTQTRTTATTNPATANGKL